MSGHHERVRGADRVAQVVDVGQDALGDGQRAGPQAVDALDLGLEGQGHELGVVGIARDGEGELAAEVARAHGACPGDLDQRAHECGDQQPGALADGVGVGAERRGGGRDGAQGAVAGGHGDQHRLLVAGALLAQLAGAALELRVEQRPQARAARPLEDRRREIVHDRTNATRAPGSVRSPP